MCKIVHKSSMEYVTSDVIYFSKALYSQSISSIPVASGLNKFMNGKMI